MLAERIETRVDNGSGFVRRRRPAVPSPGKLGLNHWRELTWHVPWPESGAVLGMFALVLGLQALSTFFPSAPPLSAVVVLATVFLTLLCGPPSGALGAAIAWAFICYLTVAKEHPWHPVHADPSHLIIWLLLFGAAVWGADRLRRALEAKARVPLRETEQRFRLLAETLKDRALIALDHEGKVAAWSLVASRLFGYRAEEALGLPLARLYPEESEIRDVPTRDLQRAAAEGRVEVESERIRKDGSRFRAQTQLIALRDDKGQLRGFSLAVRDLAQGEAGEATFVHRAHQQVAVAALGQAALVGVEVDTLMEHAAMFIAQTLEVEFASVLELHADGTRLHLKAGSGWRSARVGEVTVSIGPNTLAGYVLASSEPVIIHELSSITRFEVPDYLKEHGVRSGISIQIHGRQRPLGILEAFSTKARQFTEDDFHFLQTIANVIATAQARKVAELENEKLAAFAQFNPNPVLEFAADGVLSYFNEAAGMLAEAVGRQSPRDILPPKTSEVTQHCLASGRNRLGLETVIEGRTLSWSFFPIPAIGRVHVYAVDITEQLNLEAQFRQAQKMEAVGQLASGVAHDFNNILTILQGHISRLLQRGPRPDQVEALEQSFAATDRASGLTRQLLTFSRRQTIQQKPVDLRDVVANMSRMLERLIGEHIALKVNPPATLPSVMADVGMLEQVLLNLAVNARDAMPRGGELLLETRAIEITDPSRLPAPEMQPGTFVQLRVTDTGCGMDAATQARIFEPFFTTKEPGKGTGLGLATVYGIVRQHQGWIEVESELSRGTTFSIMLPATTVTVEKVATENDLPEIMPGGDETILIVEDEPLLRELAHAILVELGYTVLQAESGTQALEVWNHHRQNVQLLLTDMVMPGGISGRELTEKLQAEKPQLKVIFTSGYTADVTGKDFTGAFLQKPYRPPHLARIVRQCLDSLN